MTKKSFKARCVFPNYRGGGTKINAIYLRGDYYFSHMVKADAENYTKAQLFDILYNWVNEIKDIPYDVQYKFAISEEKEFKVSLTA